MEGHEGVGLTPSKALEHGGDWIDRRSWYLGQAEVYGETVKRGKLAASMLVPEDSLEAVVALLNEKKVHHSIHQVEDGWYDLWLWWKPLAAELIRALPLARAHLPAAVYAWYAGCLFGYSPEAVEEYVRDLQAEYPAPGESVNAG